MTPPVGTQTLEGDRSHRIIPVGDLVDDRVRNPAGEDLGLIEEIMIDLPSGNIAYAVLSFGGFLGLGDKLFAVPWSALELNTAEREFILDIGKEALENAPGFDKNEWPDMADPVWRAQLHAHYSRT